MSNLLKSKKILVFGTGAVGGYYGGVLLKTGFDVTFIARGESYRAIKDNGLTLIIEGKREILPVKVVGACSDKPLQGKFDYIFICVKSKDTRQAAMSIRECIGPETTIVSFQNGVENEDIIAGIVGKENVIGGLVFVASRMVKPGVIEQFGYNGGMIGELYKNEVTERVINLQKIMRESEVDCKIADDMRGELWNKLVWNASFNSISVLTGKTVDKILEENLEQVKNIMCEVRDVALAHGIKIRPDTVEFNIKRSEGFAGFKTSTLQDHEQGKPIELEELVGVVIGKAKEKNVPLMVVPEIYRRLKEKIGVNIKTVS